MKQMFCFCFFILCAFTSHAQVSMVEILKRALLIVSESEKKGAQVMFLQVDVLKKGVRSSQTYYLSNDQNYGIFAIGDDRIKDIDLCVFDENGNEIGCDKDEKNIAIVKVTPKWRGEFKFTVNAYAMESGYSDGFCALVVIRL